MSRRWTDEQIIQALRDWEAIFGSPPTSLDWKTADPEGLYPSSETVREHFGTWTDGVATISRSRKRRRSWTREEIIERYQEWARDDNGLPPASVDLGPENDLPSFGTLRRAFGDDAMASAARAAGLVPRPSGLTRKQVKRYLPLRRAV